MNEVRTEHRQRSYGWQDPRAGLAEGRRLSGREYLERIMRGELPAAPMAVTLGFRLSEVGDGSATFVCEPGEFLFNPIGSVHGGLAATMIDSATGCAVHSQLPAGTLYTTVNLSIDFIKAVSERAGLLTCRGQVVRAGARIAVADADLKDAAGVLYARGSATCLIMRPDSR
jgi:uncharacterized protein (TIGR00369 family)